MSTTIFRAHALAFVAGASSAGAQAPLALRWELYGNAYRDGEPYAVDLSFIDFVQGPDVHNDALYTGSLSGVWRRNSGPDEAMEDLSYLSSQHIVITRQGGIITGSRAGNGGDGSLSVDSGVTWQTNVITLPVIYNGLPVERGCGVVALLQSTLPALGGAVYAGCGPEIWRPFGGGAFHTWAYVGGAGGELRDLFELPVSPALPEGRLVAAMQGRIAFSDDGGATWTAGFNGGAIVETLSLAPDAAHPYGGTLYAGGREFGRGPDPLGSVYVSDDGAASWRRVHAFVDGEFLARPGGVKVFVGPDGALYGGLMQVVGGPSPNLGTVVRSRDAG